jgi:putative ABC transport system permease protein
MMLLRLITWPYVRQHLLRCLLTTAGIVLGVAVFVGMHTANQSVLYAFNKTVDRIAGATQLQVTAGETGFDEDVLERVQNTGGVDAAVPVIEATVQTGIQGQGNLLILGVDMTGDRSLRDYELENGDDSIVDDPLVFLAQPDSLIVTREFSRRTGLQLNDKVSMQTMQGQRKFTIRGIMKSGGLSSAFGGNLAIMDVYAAQMVFGRGRKFDRVDLTVVKGQDVGAVRQRLRAELGPGLSVEPPSARGQQFEAMAQVYSLTANVTSLFALFIGLFLIYNTFSIAVTQRRSEIGILRALGASQGQVKRLFLIESGIAGLFGSLLGLGVGVLIARGLATYLSAFLGEVYGVAQRAEEISADPRLLLLALFAGTATSVLAGWIPARNAAAVDPVKALQKGRIQVISAGENRSRFWVACACIVAATLCVVLGHRPVFFYSGYMLSILAALLVTPFASSVLVRGLRPLLKWLRPVEGALAADSLLQAPRRTSSTVAALCLSLALVIGLGGVAKSSFRSIQEWTTVALSPDLFVTSSESLTQRSFLYPASMADDLRTVPGVEEVQAVRTARVLYQGVPVMLISGDVRQLSRRFTLQPVAGDPATMYLRAARGEGIIISDNFSLLRKVRMGDTLEIMSPAGPVKLPVLGITVDYSDQQGSLLLDQSVYRKYWNDDTVNIFRLYLRKGATSDQVRQAILARLGGQSRIFVFTNEQLRGYILRLTEQWFGLTYIQIFVAVLVAILGIVNTLTVSIADRRRELGVLQAVGGLRNQIRHTIWMEAATIGLLGLILGFALGAVNLYYILEVTRRDLAGLRLAYTFPIEIAAALLPIILGAAFLSALGPAESAVRTPLVQALEYE